MTETPPASGRFARVAAGCFLAGAWIACAIGTLGLLGWIFRLPALVKLIPGSSIMVFNTALAISVLGAALLAAGRGRRLPALVAAGLIFALAAGVLLQFPLGRSLGLDDLLWDYRTLGDPTTLGRMSPHTALALAFAAASLALQVLRPERWRAAATTAAIPTAAGLVLFFGYVLDLPLAFSWNRFAGTALPTTLALLALGVSLLGLLLRRRTAPDRAPAFALALFSAAIAIVIAVGAAALVSHARQRDSIARAVEAERRTALVFEIEAALLLGEIRLREALETARGPTPIPADPALQRAGQILAELRGLTPADETSPAYTPITRFIAIGSSLLAIFENVHGELHAGHSEEADAIFRAASSHASAVDLVTLARAVGRIERAVAADLRTASLRDNEESDRLSLLGYGLAIAFFLGTAETSLREAAARRSAELRIVEANRRLSELARFRQALLDGTSFSVVAATPDGVITAFNAGAEKMLGYSAAEMIGRATPTLFHDPAEVSARAAELSVQLGRPVEAGFEAFVALARTQPADEREWTYLCRDGSRLRVLVSVSALRDDAGAIVGYIGIALDIGARHAAQLALSESEERFRQTFEHAGIGMAILDLDGRWTRVNPALLAIVGYTEHELLQKTFQDITHPDDLAPDLALVADLLANRRRSYQLVKRYLHREGRIVWIRLTGALVRDESGHPLNFVAQIEDLTESRRAEAALRESEELNRLFSEHAPAAVAMFDREMRYLIVSRKWIADYRLEGREILGRCHYEIFPDLPDRWKEVHRRALAGAIERSEGERFDRADSSTRWIRWEVRPWKRADDSIGGIVMFTADITAQKHLELELATARDRALEASRLKSEFLATVSHEIRTPMNAVVGMSTVLLDTPLDAEQREMARIVLGGAEALLAIINDILDLSRIEAGKLRLDLQDFELAAVVAETIALLAPAAHSKHLAFTCDLDPAAAPYVRGDPGRLRQILLNLVGNALKFTSRGQVAVSGRLEPAGPGRVRLRCEIRDTGIGIPPEAHGRLFQPFSQADGSTTREYGGSGLGLAISRQIVELMEGTVGFSSIPGTGSTFWFELPLGVASTPAPVAAAPSRSSDAPSGFAPSRPGLRLLLVEDNSANQIVAATLLRRFGFAFDLASDGEDALRALAAGRYDGIVLDCQMPRLDGYDTARRIRRGDVAGLDPRIPIVALTAYTGPEDRRKCLDAGMDDYLAKPVRAGELGPVLARCGLAAPAIAPPGARVFPAAPPASPFDPVIVASLRQLPATDGRPVLHQLVALLRTDIPVRLATLASLAATRDTAELPALAHLVAGSAANLGARELRAAALALESAARAGDWTAVRLRLDELSAVWTKLEPDLADLVA